VSGAAEPAGFAAALAAFQSGRSAEATVLCRAILATRPEDGAACHLLGVALEAGGGRAVAGGGRLDRWPLTSA